MASNNELTLTIKANSSSAEAAFSRMIAAVNKLADQADKSISNASNGFSKLSVTAIALGNVIANVVTSAWGKMTAQIGSAITRFDTLNNFPKVMTNLGIATDKSRTAIQTIADSLKGLPTSLDAAAAGVQRLVSKNGDLDKSTKMFLALNNAILAGGGSTEIQSTAIEQLTQAYSKGKPDMVEWRSLLVAMPAQLKQVALAMGFVDADALGESLRSGKTSMDSFMTTMIRLNAEGVSGFASFETQARSATGGIQTGVTNMETAITRGWTKILEAIGSEAITQRLANTGAAFETLLTIVANVIKFFGENKVASDILSASLSALAITAAIASTNTVILATNIAYLKVATAVANGIGGLQTSILRLSLAMRGSAEAASGISKALNIIVRHPIIAVIALIVTAFTALFLKTETGQKLLQKFGEIAGSVFGTIGNVIGKVSSAIMPALSSAMESIGKVMGDMASKAGPVISELFTKIGDVFSIIASSTGPALNTVFKFIGEALSSVGNSISKMMPYLGKMISSFGEIINALFPTLVPLVSSIINLFVTLGVSVGKIAIALFQALQPLIPLFVQIVVSVAKLVAQLAGLLVPIIKLIVTLVGALIAAIVPIVAIVVSIVAQIIAALIPIATMIIQLIATIIQAIMPIVTTVISIVASILSVVINLVTQIMAALMPIINFVAGMVTGIINLIAPILTFVANLIVAIMNVILPIVVFTINLVAGLITSVVNIITGIISFITGVITTIIGIIGTIVQAVSGIISSVLKFFSDGFGAVISLVNGAVNGIINFFRSIPNNIKGVVDTIVGFFSGIGKTIGDFIAGGFKAIINGALKLTEDFLNGPIRLINGAIDTINKIPGVNISRITEIRLPRMNDGGILGGNSYTGDKQLFYGNTGEMIINRTDQASLWDAIKGGRFGGGSNATLNIAEGAIVINAGQGQNPDDIAIEVVQAIKRAFVSQGLPVDLKFAGELR